MINKNKSHRVQQSIEIIPESVKFAFHTRQWNQNNTLSLEFFYWKNANGKQGTSCVNPAEFQKSS